MEDIEKRKEVYGICGECNEPGTGLLWCQPCNAKRFEENFKNWTSGNKNVDEFIQQSQLNAVHHTNDYMMILMYCDNGDLRNYLSKSTVDYARKLAGFFTLVIGLLDIHNAGLIHGDLHSGNVLSVAPAGNNILLISDLGMCRPA